MTFKYVRVRAHSHIILPRYCCVFYSTNHTGLSLEILALPEHIDIPYWYRYEENYSVLSNHVPLTIRSMQ
jgi:hypothetical protein